MGNGYFDGRKLHFVVAALYEFTGTDEGDCIDILQRASIFLHQATLGQVQFGTIFLADNTLAIADAEALLIPERGTTSSTRGGFGEIGRAISLLNDTRTTPNLIIHEFGHHLWDLGDEYSKSFYEVTIDRSSGAPDKKTVPIISDSSLNAPVPPDTDFLTVFSGVTERKPIESTTATVIKLKNELRDLATSADNTRGDVAFPSICGDPVHDFSKTFCIMEHITLLVTDFCDDENHNSSQDSDQQSKHGESCWKTIVNRPGYTHLISPPGPPTQPQLDAVNIVRLLASARFALLLDISGSMQGEQLRYAKHGIAYWLDYLSGTGDQLTVIAFNDQANVVLPLTLVGPGLDLVAVNSQIDTLAASGNTNIRDAIREGVQQITSVAGTSAVQATVLLTDGKHNRPVGTSVSEVLGELRSNYVKLAALGIGGPDDIDMEELNDLASATNGYSSFIDVNSDLSEIENILITAQQTLLGELFEFASFEIVPPPPNIAKDVHPKLKSLYGRKAHVGLRGALDAIGTNLHSLAGGRGIATELRGLFTVHPFLVEEGCEAINAAINFNEIDAFDLWLLDPALAEMTSADPKVRMNRDAAHPHRFCIVNRPIGGIWRAVLLRRPSAKAQRNRQTVRVHLSVGGKHREVKAVARTRKAVFSPRESVVFEARARWVHPLTDLHVEAEIRDPTGRVTRIPLHDGELLSDSAGTYLGEFRPTKTGKHKALVRISNRHTAHRADGLYLTTHSSTNTRVDLRTRATPFQRLIPITFDVTKI
jgi:uncharacterized protein YegL